MLYKSSSSSLRFLSSDVTYSKSSASFCFHSFLSLMSSSLSPFSLMQYLPPLVLLLSIYTFIVLLTTWFSCLIITIANTNVAIPPEPSLKPPPHWPSPGLNHYAFCPSFFSSSTSSSTFSFFSYAFFIGQISLPYIMVSLICHWPRILWGCMNAG